jgi:hypothetical protein
VFARCEHDAGGLGFGFGETPDAGDFDGERFEGEVVAGWEPAAERDDARFA